jgi:hypothetical protein
MTPVKQIIIEDPIQACIGVAFLATLVGIFIGCMAAPTNKYAPQYRGASQETALRAQMIRRRDAINHLLERN